MLRDWLKRPESDVSGIDHPYWEIPLILVSGFGRSGTTILRKCIAAHHQIDCADRESNLIYDLMKVGRETREDKDRVKNLVVTQKEYWMLFRHMILHLNWPLNQIKRDSPPRAIATYSAMSPVSAIGLAKTFPKHRILWIVRNGIEVVSSRMNFDAFKRADFREICRAWQISMQMLDYGKKWGNFSVFRHEWLQDENLTNDHFRSLFHELELSFDEACAKVAQSTQVHPTKILGETKPDRRDLTMRANRWKYWTDEQRRIFVEECSKAMQELGYGIPWV